MNFETILDELFQIGEAVNALSNFVCQNECEVGTEYLMRIMAKRIRQLYEEGERHYMTAEMSGRPMDD